MTAIRITLLCMTILLFLSCNNGTSQESSGTEEGMDKPEEAKVETMLKASMGNVEPTKYHEFRDPGSGLVQARYPIPQSWNVHSPDAAVYIDGPKGMKVYKGETNNFAWSNDPMMQQTIQMSGQNIGQPLNNLQILAQVVKPNAEGQGYKFIKSYPLPEVSGLWQRLFHAMPNTGSQRDVEALGTEWESGSGKKSFILLVRYQTFNHQILNWSIQTTELEAEVSYFDKAVNAYQYSIANAQLNPQWIQHMNGKLIGEIKQSNKFWADATASSAAAHQQRMAAISSRGNTASQTAQTYSDILDISHNGYLNRSHINDSGHDKSVRAISGTTLIGNHETGEHYSVPSGANYYWVSNDGYYISTDNALLDPNIEKALNEKAWTKFAAER